MQEDFWVLVSRGFIKPEQVRMYYLLLFDAPELRKDTNVTVCSCDSLVGHEYEPHGWLVPCGRR